MIALREKPEKAVQMQQLKVPSEFFLVSDFKQIA